MGKITLIGFDLENIENLKINKIIQKYEKKLLYITDYQEISLRLRKSLREKTFFHEVECKIITDSGVFNSKEEGYNLFAIIADVLEKTVKEISHKNKKIQRKNEKKESKRKRQDKIEPNVPKIN